MHKANRHIVAVGHVIAPPTSVFVESVRVALSLRFPKEKHIVYPEEKYRVAKGSDTRELLRTTFRMAEAAFARHGNVQFAAALYPSAVVFEHSDREKRTIDIVLCTFRNKRGYRWGYTRVVEKTYIPDQFLLGLARAVVDVIREFDSLNDEPTPEELRAADNFFAALEEGIEFALHTPETNERLN